MESVVEIIQSVVLIFIDVVGLAMLVRAILSFLGSEESALGQICYAISEPLVFPVRAVMSRIPGIMELGIDFSFMATYLVLVIIDTVLLSVV